MTKARIFFLGTISFIGGILAASFYFQIIADYYFLLAVALILIVLVIFYQNKYFLLASLMGLFFLGGFWLTDARLAKLSQLDLVGQNFADEVLVVKEPVASGQIQKLILESRSGEQIIVNVPLYPEYAYGDQLKLRCALELPENFDPNFDYRMYLAKENIFYTCQRAQLNLVQANRGNRVYSTILALKQRVEKNIEQVLSSPQSGLLIGLLLGGDDKLPKNIQADFSRTGMTHIVAVSGYNVTIIAEYLILLALAVGLWRRQAFWFALTGIFLFVFMIGFPASAVRAGLMGALLLWAMKNGRLANAENAILCAAVVMLMLNPLLLRWDVGFQLSFLATLGIVYVYPLVEKILTPKMRVGGILEMLLLTLSAQVFVLPVILLNFQNLPLISPVANLLVLPLAPVTMLLGFLLVLAQFVVPPLAPILSWLVFLPLKYEVATISFLARLKWSAVAVGNFIWIWAAGWYIVLIGLILFLKKERADHEEPI